MNVFMEYNIESTSNDLNHENICSKFYGWNRQYLVLQRLIGRRNIHIKVMNIKLKYLAR